MGKSITSKDYKVLLAYLRETREEAGLTQIDLADRLGMTQSQISKCERGERRLDVIELREWCTAMGTDLMRFAKALDERLPPPRASQKSPRR